MALRDRRGASGPRGLGVRGRRVHAGESRLGLPCTYTKVTGADTCGTGEVCVDATCALICGRILNTALH